MGIKKEYVCLAHGSFESDQPKCPHGCTMAIEREFRTAPALKSPRTRNIDHTLQTLARDFGYSDLSNRSGAVAGGRGNPKRGPADLRPQWKPVPKGDLQKAGGVIESRGGSQGGAAAAYAAQKPLADRQGDPTFTDIQAGLGQPKPVVQDKRFVFGSSADLKSAIDRVA